MTYEIHAAGKVTELRAQLAAVTTQRDELLRAAEPCCVPFYGGVYHDALRFTVESVRSAIRNEKVDALDRELAIARAEGAVMSIPTDRLREIANPVYVPCVGQDEAIAIATELLACREERDAANYRAEKAENDLRCVTLTGDAVASDSSLYRGNSVRYWYDKCQAYKNSAGELAAERERFNLLSQRCDAAERERDAARIRGDDLAGRLAVAIVWRRSLARVCNDFIEAFDEHGVYDGLFYGSDSWLSALRAEVRAAQPTKSEVIAERDAARAEAEKLRDEAYATLDDVCKALGADVDSAVAQALMFKEKAGDLAAVKRQRDELLAAADQVADALRDVAGAGHLAYLDAFDAAAAACTAEQPKPQQPEVQP